MAGGRVVLTWLAQAGATWIRSLPKLRPSRRPMKAWPAIFQAIDEVFAELDLAGFQPGAHGGEEAAVAIAVVVKNDEAWHLDAFDQEGAGELAEAVGPVGSAWSL